MALYILSRQDRNTEEGGVPATRHPPGGQKRQWRYSTSGSVDGAFHPHERIIIQVTL